MTIEVSQLEMADSAILTVKNIRGDDDLIGDDGVNPVTIEVFSPGSAQGVKADHKARRTAQPRTWRWMRNEFHPNDGPEQDRERAEKLKAVTKEIKNLSIPALDIYSNPKLGYVTRQVEEFYGNAANFSKASLTTSP